MYDNARGKVVDGGVDGIIEPSQELSKIGRGALVARYVGVKGRSESEFNDKINHSLGTPEGLRVQRKFPQESQSSNTSGLGGVASREQRELSGRPFKHHLLGTLRQIPQSLQEGRLLVEQPSNDGSLRLTQIPECCLWM